MVRAAALFPALAICLVLLTASEARTDDEPVKPKPEGPTPRQPAPPLRPVRMPFTAAEILPGSDDLPAGWETASIAETLAEPDAAPRADALRRMARVAGVPDDATHVRVLGLVRRDGARIDHASLAYVVLEVEGTTLAPQLAKEAAARGWKLRDVALPSAVLIAWSSDERATAGLLAWQTATTVRRLCEQGWRAMATSRAVRDPLEAQTSFARGQAKVAAARDTMPEAGYVHAILARLFLRDPARAAEHARKALADGAPVPPPPAMIVEMAFSIGALLLTRGSEADLATAAAALEAAVAVEEAAAHPNHRFGNRYNLACTYARQGRLEPAFLQLEESLRYMKAAWEADLRAEPVGRSELDYPGHHRHAQVLDADLNPLRADPRFAKLIAAHAPEIDRAGSASNGK